MIAYGKLLQIGANFKFDLGRKVNESHVYGVSMGTEFRLTRQEGSELHEFSGHLCQQFQSADDPRFIFDAGFNAHRLPARLRIALNRFRLEDTEGYLLIKGYPLDNNAVGRTPEHWRRPVKGNEETRLEISTVLVSALLGDVFAWSTQQDGALIHNVLPIRGHEEEQLGSSSKALLTWHVEDAFHKYRPDYLVLACIRNPTLAQTAIGEMKKLKLSQEDRNILMKERFIISPDESHLPENNPGSSATGHDKFAGVERLRNEASYRPVLFGGEDTPYICADPYFMSVAEGDEEAEFALRRLVAIMDSTLEDVELSGGDMLVINNYRAVHGRKPFDAKFDGNDRWLKRTVVTRNLRASRADRSSALGRSILT